MITITRFSASNFLSFESLDFTVDAPGMTYIGGSIENDLSKSNGSGKSSLWEIVPYALYGRTIRGLAREEVIKHGENKCRAELWFSVDETPFRIIRSWAKSKQKLSFFKSDVDVSAADVKSTQILIDNVLGMSFDLFTNSVLFGQGLSYRFIQAPDAEKKEIFEQLLELGWIRKAGEKAKGFLSSMRTEQVERLAVCNDIKLITARIEEEIKRWSAVEGRDFDKEHDAIFDAMNAVGEEKKKVGDMLRSASSHDAARKQFDSLHNVQEAFKRLIMVMLGEAGRLQRVLGNSKKVLDDAFGMQGKECPTCFQIVQGEHLGNLKMEQRIFTDIAGEFLSSENSYLLRMRDAENGISSLCGLSLTQLAQAEKIEKEASSKMQDLNIKMTILSARLRALQMDREKDNARLETIRGLQAELLMKNTERRHEEESINDLNLYLDIADFWVDAFGNKGIKSLVIDSIITWMNEVSEYFATKICDANLTPRFSSTSILKSGEERETLSVFVRKAARGDGQVEEDVDYKSISGGEKRRVDVVVLLTLCKLLNALSGRDANILVFDEVFESLDPEGIEKVVLVLSEFVDEGKSVYVISHQEEVKSFFEKEITVNKSSAGTSTISK